MPASVIADMNGNSGGGLEEQRALQLALELSMFGLGSDEDGGSPPLNAQYNEEHTKGGKKSANMTECVPVPSSEHVAEIVGRQGESAVS